MTYQESHITLTERGRVFAKHVVSDLLAWLREREVVSSFLRSESVVLLRRAPNFLSVSQSEISFTLSRGSGIGTPLRHSTTVFTVERSLSIAAEVAEFLDDYHSLGMAHGRLDWDGICVQEDGHVLVVDMGLGIVGDRRHCGRDVSALGSLLDGLLDRCPPREGRHWEAAKTTAGRLRGETGARGASLELRRCLMREFAGIATGEGASSSSSQMLHEGCGLVGRESELTRMREELERVRETRGKALVLISAREGLGKSSLVREFERRVNFPYASGRGVCQEDVVAVVRALDDVVAQAIDLPTPENQVRLERLRKELGRHLSLAWQVMPSVRRLGLAVPARGVEALSSLDSERVASLCCSVARSLVAAEAPLLLLVDNLHLAEPITFHIIEALFQDPEISNLMLIGAYRLEDVGVASSLHSFTSRFDPKGSSVLRLHLGPLRPCDMTQVLARKLGARASDQSVVEFADELNATARGSPLLMEQAAWVLAGRGLLTFDTGSTSWRWNIASLRTASLPSSSESLVAERLGLLCQFQRQIVRAVALLEPTSFDTLRHCFAAPSDVDLPDALAALEALQLLHVQLTPGLPLVTLSHVAVKQAALASSESQDLMPGLTAALMGRDFPEDVDECNVLFAFSRLSAQRQSQVGSADELKRFVSLSLTAVEQARIRDLQTMAHCICVNVRKVISKFVPRPGTEESLVRECRKRIELELSRNERNSGHYVESVIAIRECLDCSVEPADRALALAEQSLLKVLHGELTDAASLSIAALGLLGIDFPLSFDDQSFASLADHLEPLATLDDELVLRILVAAVKPLWDVRSSMLPFVGCVAMGMGMAGATVPPYLEAIHGYFIAARLGRVAEGLQVAERAYLRAHEESFTGSLPHLCALYANYILPFRAGVTATDRINAEGASSGLPIGDIESASYCLAMRAINKLVAGSVELSQVRLAAEEALHLWQGRGPLAVTGDSASLCHVAGGIVALLRDGVDSPKLEMLATASSQTSSYFHYVTLRALCVMLLGQPDVALGLVGGLELLPYRYVRRGLPLASLYMTLRLLSCLLCGGKAQPDDLEELRVLAATSPAQYDHLWVMVRAQEACSRGDTESGMHDFTAAVEAARQCGNLHHYALCCEVLVIHLIEFGTVATLATARTYFARQIDVLNQWGATAVVRKLIRSNPRLVSAPISQLPQADGEARLSQALLLLHKQSHGSVGSVLRQALLTGLEFFTATRADFVSTAASDRGGQGPVVSLRAELGCHDVITPDEPLALAEPVVVFAVEAALRSASPKRQGSVCSVPLVVCADEVIGALCFCGATADGIEQMERLATFAAHVSLALSNARRSESQEKSQQDMTRQLLLRGREANESTDIIEVESRGHLLAEDSLRAIESRFRLLFENSISPTILGKLVVTADGSRDIQWVNINTAAKLKPFPLTSEAVEELRLSMMTSVGKLFSKEDFDFYVNLATEVTSTGRPKHFVTQLTGPLGSRVLEGDAYALDGPWLVVTNTDITDQRRLEEKMQQAQRMDSLVTMAGGIAHDFNNLVGVLTSPLTHPRAHLTARIHDVPAAQHHCKCAGRCVRSPARR